MNREWRRRYSYDLQRGETFRFTPGGPLFVVTVADESPISATKVIHCGPAENPDSAPTFFYTDQQATETVWVTG